MKKPCVSGPCDEQPCGDVVTRVVVDFAIAGAGTAGAVVAKRLTDDFSVTVHVGEGGSDTRNDPEVLDTVVGPELPTPGDNWVYGNDPSLIPTTGIGQAPPTYLAARMWGGCSGHNFLLAVRGTPGLYREWAAIDPRWSYPNLLPIMKGIETYTPLSTGFFDAAERGGAGPVFITQGAQQGPVIPTSALVLALASQGAPYTKDYNDPTQGVFVSGDPEEYVTPPPDVHRSWAANAFLGPDVVDEAGVGVGGRQLTIDSGVVAIRLLFEDDFSGEELQALAREHGLPNLTSACRRCAGSSDPPPE